MKKNKASKYTILNHLKKQMKRIGGDWRHMHDYEDSTEVNLICLFPNNFLVFVRIEPSGVSTPGYRKTYTLFDRCGAMQYMVDSVHSVDKLIQLVLDYGQVPAAQVSEESGQKDFSLDEKDAGYPNW